MLLTLGELKGSADRSHGADRTLGFPRHADHRAKVHEGLVVVEDVSAWKQDRGQGPQPTLHGVGLLLASPAEDPEQERQDGLNP